MDKIGFCDCGAPYIVMQGLHEVLKIMDEEKPSEEREDKIRKAAGSEASYWLWLYWMDKMEYTEHGACITFGWLSQEGKELLERLNKCETDEDYWDLYADLS